MAKANQIKGICPTPFLTKSINKNATLILYYILHNFVKCVEKIERVNMFKSTLNRKGKFMRKRSYNKIDKILEMPKEVYSDIPKVTITGFNEMVIENFKGILEYEEYFVRINTHIGIININGFNLNLENMTNDDIRVTGKIESMDIERTVD